MFEANLLKALLVAIMTVAIASMGIAYAEQQVSVALPFDDHYIHMNCWTQVSQGGGVGEMIYHCVWNWFIQPDTATEIERIMEEDKDPLLDELFIKELVKKNPLIIPEVEELPEVIEPEVDIPIEPLVPLTWEERQIEDSVAKLEECLRGLGAWGAYQTAGAIPFWVDESRQSFGIRDNLSSSIHLKRILLAIEECDAMKTYERLNYIGVYELNKYLADLAGVDYLGRHEDARKLLDVTDSIYTDPVTPKDLAQEVSESERIFAELFKDPNADFTGINRGGQPAGAVCQAHGQPYQIDTGFSNEEVCPLDNYNRLILEQADSLTYEGVKQLQCDNYFGMYEHKKGTDEFPTWLDHCLTTKDLHEIEVARNAEQCFDIHNLVTECER